MKPDIKAEKTLLTTDAGGKHFRIKTGYKAPIEILKGQYNEALFEVVDDTTISPGESGVVYLTFMCPDLEAAVTSNVAHSLSVCYWVAGPRIRQSLLPPNCFKHENTYPLSVLLFVKGRKKCLIVSMGNIPKGCYCWIDERHGKR